MLAFLTKMIEISAKSRDIQALGSQLRQEVWRDSVVPLQHQSILQVSPKPLLS